MNQELIEAARTGNYPATPGEHCTFCDYRTECAQALRLAAAHRALCLIIRHLVQEEPFRREVLVIVNVAVMDADHSRSPIGAGNIKWMGVPLAHCTYTCSASVVDWPL